MSSSDISDSVL